jgi:hypothetical protein
VFSRPLNLTSSLRKACPRNGAGWTFSLGGWTDRYLGYLTMRLQLLIQLTRKKAVMVCLKAKCLPQSVWRNGGHHKIPQVGLSFWRSRILTATYQVRIVVLWDWTKQCFSVRIPVGGLRLKNFNKSENDYFCVIKFRGMLCAKQLRRNSEFFWSKFSLSVKKLQTNANSKQHWCTG